MSTQLSDISVLLPHYNTFLIDQFGVLHDGIRPYDFAIESLRKLKSAGKNVVIISNSGKLSHVNMKRIERFGIDDSLYDYFVTSGDVAFDYLKRTSELSSKTKCFLMSRDEDTSIINGLPFEITKNPGDADLIIIGGSQADIYDEEYYRLLLSDAALANTLCICTNPDMKMLTSDGLRFGAGRIADIYEELGGVVVRIGKPHYEIYSYVFNLVGDISKEKTLCIGDSLEHDIAGGNDFSISTLLIRKGVSESMNDAELGAYIERTNIVPDYITQEFKIA